VRRVLRREGVALITTPNVRYVRHLWNLVVRGRGPRTGDQIQIDGAWDNGHIHYFTHSDLREVFLQAGFRTVQSLALINDRGSLGWARNLLSRNAASYLVREFMSGNILLLAFR